MADPRPADPTSFVDREREVAALTRLLRRPGVRLVTSTGPGGVGKTRLAQRAAEALAPGVPDGAVWIDLSQVADPHLVAPVMTGAPGVRDAGDRSPAERLIDALHARRLLVVLDNFEHVVEAAPQVGRLLAACPGVMALVTSREPPRLSAEGWLPFRRSPRTTPVRRSRNRPQPASSASLPSGPGLPAPILS